MESQAPKFKMCPALIVPDLVEGDRNTCPIEILEGAYSGWVFRYGQINFRETGEDMFIDMELIPVAVPNGADLNTQDFVTVAGRILESIILSPPEIETPFDLEADVHEDPPEDA